MVKYLFLPVFITASLYLFSNESSLIDIDIDSALEKAMTQNYDLKKETLNLLDKKMTFYDSWTVFSPSANMSFSISKKLDSSATSSSSATNNPSFGISISQPLEAKMIFGILQNYYDYKDGKISYEKYKKSLANDIKKNYYSIVLLREQLNLKKQSLANARERYDQSLIQFREGEISELDRMNRELSYKTLIPDYSKAENIFNYSLDQFKILIGIDIDKKINLTTGIPNINFRKIANNYFDGSPDNNLDYELIANRIKRDMNARNAFISQLMPTLSISYVFSDSFQKDPYASGWDNPADWKVSNTISFSVALKLDNILPMSSTQLNIIKSQNTIERDDLDLKKQIVKNKAELKSIRSKIEQILATYENLKFNVELSKQVYKYTVNEFKNGSKNLNDVKDAETAMNDSNIKLLGGQYDMVSLICDLEMLLNVEIKKGDEQ
jgi:outer membrane protein TolC